jgi:hypothetical protein
VKKTPLTDLSVEALQAMQAELEAETKRRLDERVERGEVLREPLVAVCAGPEDAAAAVAGSKALELAELKAAGETREVHFDEPLVMMTGVPRPGRDDKYIARRECEDNAERHRRESKCAARHDAQSVAAREPELCMPPPMSKAPEGPAADELEWHPVWVQVRAPNPELGDPGQIIEGRFAVSQGMVRVEDTGGRALGSQALGPSDDPLSIARQLLREKHGSTFWGPIEYGPSRLV